MGCVVETKQDVGNLVHGLHVDNAICVDLGQGHDTLQHMIKGSHKQVLAWQCIQVQVMYAIKTCEVG